MLTQEQAHLEILFECLFQIVEVELLNGKKLLGFLASVNDKNGDLKLRYCIDQDSNEILNERIITGNEYIRFTVTKVPDDKIPDISEDSQDNGEFGIGFEIDSLQGECEEGGVSRKSQKSEMSSKTDQIIENNQENQVKSESELKNEMTVKELEKLKKCTMQLENSSKNIQKIKERNKKRLQDKLKNGKLLLN